MAGKISKIINLVGNMGWRYVSFRARYELLKKTGLLKNKFPVNPAYKQYVTLAEWKLQKAAFFFNSRETLTLQRNPQPALKETVDNIKSGKLLLFNSILASP